MSVLIISIIFLIGCTKGGVIPIPEPLPTPTPEITITPLDGPVFYGQSAEVKYSTTNATELRINDSLVPLSGVFSLSNLKEKASLTFVAKNTKKTAMQNTQVLVYEKNLSILMFIPQGKTGIWRSTKIRFFYDNVWHPGGTPVCQPTLFKPNGYSTGFNSECHPGQPSSETKYSFNQDDNTILWNGSVFSIVFPNDTTLVRSLMNNVGQLVEETFVKN